MARLTQVHLPFDSIERARLEQALASHGDSYRIWIQQHSFGAGGKLCDWRGNRLPQYFGGPYGSASRWDFWLIRDQLVFEPVVCRVAELTHFFQWLPYPKINEWLGDRGTE